LKRTVEVELGLEDTVVPPTLGGSYVYMANIAARAPIFVKNDSGSKDKDELKPYAEIVSRIGEQWAAKYSWGNVSCLVDPIHDRMDMGEYAR
jgi:hypothetical protein